MDPAREPSTSLTLLGRLRLDPMDQTAWNEFVERYGPRIAAWCRRRGLQAADLEDVTQDVLLRLARTMKTFAYDPLRSFRAWLFAVTINALNDFAQQRRNVFTANGNGRILELLDNQPARADLLQELDDLFDRELLEEAELRVRVRVDPLTWDAFRLFEVEGMTAREVACQLNIPVGHVYVYAMRVRRKLREAVQQLDDEAPP